jgi:PilZ domain-containing protein
LNANRLVRGASHRGRRSPRLPIELQGALKGLKPRAVLLLDLSATGCLTRAPAAFDGGTILDLEVALPGRPWSAKVRVSSCALDGTVAPSERPRYLVGLEFLGLSAQDADVLRRFLAEEQRRRSADTAAH